MQQLKELVVADNPLGTIPLGIDRNNTVDLKNYLCVSVIWCVCGLCGVWCVCVLCVCVMYVCVVCCVVCCVCSFH